MKARLFTDGGARPNPGAAAIAYVLETPPEVVIHAETIGFASNNVAEYRAVLAGLEKARDLGLDEVEVVSDSTLIVNQLAGKFRIKEQHLMELSIQVRDVAHAIGTVAYTNVRREENVLADLLVNQVLDAAKERLS